MDLCWKYFKYQTYILIPLFMSSKYVLGHDISFQQICVYIKLEISLIA